MNQKRDSSERYYPKNKKTGLYDEWAAVINSQHEAAQIAQQEAEVAKRTHLTAEYGKNQYLAQQDHKQQAKLDARRVNVEDRVAEDSKFEAFQKEEQMKRV